MPWRLVKPNLAALTPGGSRPLQPGDTSQYEQSPIGYCKQRMPRGPRSPSKARRPPPEPCTRCHAGDARQMIGGEGPLCSSCADELMSTATGWPRLEGPPPAEMFRGADGVQHRMV